MKARGLERSSCDTVKNNDSTDCKVEVEVNVVECHRWCYVYGDQSFKWRSYFIVLAHLVVRPPWSVMPDDRRRFGTKKYDSECVN